MGRVVDAQSVEYLAHLSIHGRLADKEPDCDIPVADAIRSQPQYLYLALGEERLSMDGRQLSSAAEQRTDHPGVHGGFALLDLPYRLKQVLTRTRFQDISRGPGTKGVCQVLIASRPGFPQVVPARLIAALPPARRRLTIVPVTPLAVSSSAIRDRLARGRSVASLVPSAVEDYILRHRLYAASK